MTPLNELKEAAEKSPAHKALLNYQQADEDGVMVLVSRQAVHEVSAQLEALQAENERLRTLLSRLTAASGILAAELQRRVDDPEEGINLAEQAPWFQDCLADRNAARAALQKGEG